MLTCVVRSRPSEDMLVTWANISTMYTITLTPWEFHRRLSPLLSMPKHQLAHSNNPFVRSDLDDGHFQTCCSTGIQWSRVERL